MQLNLTRPLISFDLETTGTIIGKDRIVEIAMVKLLPNGKQETFREIVNPEMLIPIEVSEIHGIYDVDVLNAPKLKDIAPKIIQFIDNCDLAGFNCLKFDVPFLIEELARIEVELDIDQHQIVDVQNIFHKMEPRTLAAAYKFYCNQDLQDAHSALADAEATLKVLLAQVDKYEIIGNNIETLVTHSTYGNKTMDFARRIAFDKDGEPIFNFGKHNGKKVLEVFKYEPSYYTWIMNGDFAKDTKNKFTKIWNQLKGL